MSDTPKTDQAKIAAGFQAVPESFLVFARKLERENAALRASLDYLQKAIVEAIRQDCRKLHRFEEICAAIDAARKEQQ